MAPRITSDIVESLDDLELELRRLPGVRARGFRRTRRHPARTAARHGPSQPRRPTGSHLGVAHRCPPLAAPRRGRGGALARRTGRATGSRDGGHARGRAGGGGTAGIDASGALAAVLAFPDTDELEVHLILDGKRTIGRAQASNGLVGAVDATIDAIRGFGALIEPWPRWARALEETTDDERVVVAVALEDEDNEQLQYGLAAGASPIDAAARSTLDALNRRLSCLF